MKIPAAARQEALRVARRRVEFAPAPACGPFIARFHDLFGTGL